MNLHAIVSPYVSAVNPMVTVGLQISIGPGATSPSGKRVPQYATPGVIVGSVAAGILTVSAVTAGLPQAGQILSGVDVPPNTLITALSTNAGDYILNQVFDLASEDMSLAHFAPAQVQALSSRDLRQIEGLNLQGTLRAIYVNGTLDGVVRPLLKGGDLVILPDGTTWLVTVVPEPWNMSAGWTKAVITLQDDPPSNLFPVIL